MKIYSFSEQIYFDTYENVLPIERIIKVFSRIRRENPNEKYVDMCTKSIWNE